MIQSALPPKSHSKLSKLFDSKSSIAIPTIQAISKFVLYAPLFAVTSKSNTSNSPTGVDSSTVKVNIP